MEPVTTGKEKRKNKFLFLQQGVFPELQEKEKKMDEEQIKTITDAVPAVPQEKENSYKHFLPPALTWLAGVFFLQEISFLLCYWTCLCFWEPLFEVLLDRFPRQEKIWIILYCSGLFLLFMPVLAAVVFFFIAFI